jgi:ABC-type multidrug transport system fused ATPase/permease subunit
MIEHSKSHIPSFTLLFYWPLQFCLLLTVYLQQLFANDNHKFFTENSELEPFLLFISLLNNAFIFTTEYIWFKPSRDYINAYIDDKLLLSEPDVFSKLTFSWMNKLLKLAYINNGLEQSDLPPPPKSVSTNYTAPILEKYWNIELKKTTSKPSLLIALIKTFGLAILGSLIFDMGESIVSFIQPQLLRKLIQFFNVKNENPLVIKGLSICLLMFLTNLISTAFYNQYIILTVKVAQGCKAALMYLVYNKAMKLSSSERNSRSTGDIINHMSVDISRIESLSSYVQTMVSAPTRLILCLWSLYWLLGKSTFIGILTMAIMIPLNTILVKSLRSFHKQQMKLKDKRTSFVSEILQNIKSIKLYAWEDPMLSKLKILRDDNELKNLNKIGILSAGINFAWTCVPFFVSCSTFAMFAIISDIPLSPEIVFPALSLFDLLSDPIFAIPSLITALIECTVSLNRIVSFLLADEIDLNLVTRLPAVKKIGKQSVKISNATFLWSKPIDNSKIIENNNTTINNDLESIIEGTKAPALKNINFKAKKGELTCILGKVGSGKSTFLKCLLGELTMIPTNDKEPCEIKINGSIAYCSQIPWIINATFKDNILFGHKYDEEFYNKTIKVCQLLPDLEILPDGHETLVGEKGISLSGGQKARLSLARAIYTRSDVYLFDDILSAVDAHVGQKIIDEVLGKNGILKTKTKILCTNSIKVLNQSSNVYLLRDNTFIESGLMKDIINDQSSEIYKIIQTNGLKNDHNNSDNQDEIKTITSLESLSSTSSNYSSDSQDLLIEGEFEGIGPLGVNVDENTGEELIRFDKKITNKDLTSTSTLNSASIASFKQLNFSNDIDRKMNQTEEIKEKGRVKWSTFVKYSKACSFKGIFITLSLVVITVGLSIASNYWLMYWSENNIKNGSNKNIFKYVGIYALLGIGSGFFTLIRAMCMWTLCSIRASKKLHYEMAKAVINSPLQFFETTPLGRIINRFSQDMNKVDSVLPRVFSALFSSCIKTLLTLIIIGYNMPIFIIIIIILSFVYNYYQRYYIITVRDLKRITSISKSPIFALIQESLNGYETIRAYGQRERFSYLNSANIDNNQISSYCLKSTNRWLSTRLQFIGSIITLSTSLLALGSLYSNNRMSAGLIGLIMSYAMRVTSSLSFIVRRSVEIESDIVCCERIFEYCKLEPEINEELIKDKLIKKLPIGWPFEGKIKFNNYSTRYRENLDPILKNISFSVNSKEKIGIIGRTGAGKSSLVLSIFRLIEPINGYIEIDGLNTSKLKLHDLRKNLSIIPQDAQCIEGTIKYNLDPLNKYNDEQIWDALKMSKLDEHVINMSIDQNLQNEPLNCQISESGSNLSVGQRQLICLARVLLKTQDNKTTIDLQQQQSPSSSKILILDEATSSIDTETDNVIQQTIRKRCNHLTILTIAHRLNTIMDNDRILVLDKGEIAEFDTPNNLLSNSESLFYKMCVDGGYIPKPE